MTSARKRIPASAVLLMMVGACGGGSGLPSDTVARVGDRAISKQSFDHWLRIFAAESPGAAGVATVPDPPDFERCMGELQKAPAPGGKSGSRPTTAEIKAQCAQRYDTLRDQVLSFLIAVEWYDGEAADAGVTMTDAELAEKYEQTKKTYPGEASFAAYLRRTGMTADDLRLRLRADMLSTKLQARKQASGGVTDRQIRAYYRANPDRFEHGEQRDLDIILLRNASRNRAERAMDAIRSRLSFRAAARRFGLDPISRNQSGVLRAVDRGRLGKLSARVDVARPGLLGGPVETQFGYYIFRVRRIIPAGRQTLAQAKPQIAQRLLAERQQQASADFVEQLRAKWTPRTECQTGFVVSGCRNGPPPPTAQSGTATAQ